LHEYLEEPAHDESKAQKRKRQLHGPGNEVAGHERSQAGRGELVDDEAIYRA
jgi:hypothetical protein